MKLKWGRASNMLKYYPVLRIKSNLEAEDVAAIWNAISTLVEKHLDSKKGVVIPGLGTFTYTTEKTEMGNNTIQIVKYPIFLLEDKLAVSHWMPRSTYYISEPVLNVVLNFEALSFLLAFSDPRLRLCFSDIIQNIHRFLSINCPFDVPFPGIGRLSFRKNNYDFIFNAEFMANHKVANIVHLRHLDPLPRKPCPCDFVVTGCPCQLYQSPEEKAKITGRQRKPCSAPVVRRSVGRAKRMMEPWTSEKYHCEASDDIHMDDIMQFEEEALKVPVSRKIRDNRQQALGRHSISSSGFARPCVGPCKRSVPKHHHPEGVFETSGRLRGTGERFQQDRECRHKPKANCESTPSNKNGNRLRGGEEKFRNVNVSKKRPKTAEPRPVMEECRSEEAERLQPARPVDVTCLPEPSDSEDVEPPHDPTARMKAARRNAICPAHCNPRLEMGSEIAHTTERDLPRPPFPFCPKSKISPRCKTAGAREGPTAVGYSAEVPSLCRCRDRDKRKEMQEEETQDQLPLPCRCGALSASQKRTPPCDGDSKKLRNAVCSDQNDDFQPCRSGQGIKSSSATEDFGKRDPCKKNEPHWYCHECTTRAMYEYGNRSRNERRRQDREDELCFGEYVRLADEDYKMQKEYYAQRMRDISREDADYNLKLSEINKKKYQSTHVDDPVNQFVICQRPMTPPKEDKRKSEYSQALRHQMTCILKQKQDEKEKKFKEDQKNLYIIRERLDEENKQNEYKKKYCQNMIKNALMQQWETKPERLQPQPNYCYLPDWKTQYDKSLKERTKQSGMENKDRGEYLKEKEKRDKEEENATDRQAIENDIKLLIEESGKRYLKMKAANEQTTRCLDYQVKEKQLLKKEEEENDKKNYPLVVLTQKTRICDCCCKTFCVDKKEADNWRRGIELWPGRRRHYAYPDD